jgi:hypothetical protein
MFLKLIELSSKVRIASNLGCILESHGEILTLQMCGSHSLDLKFCGLGLLDQAF